jgi:hypothetical protein
VLKKNYTGMIGFLSTQKCTAAAMRMLAYGTPKDAKDKYLRIGDYTVIESMYRLCRAIVVVLGPHYL